MATTVYEREISGGSILGSIVRETFRRTSLLSVSYLPVHKLAYTCKRNTGSFLVCIERKLKTLSYVKVARNNFQHLYFERSL